MSDGDDPYFYPGTDVLRNKANLRNKLALDRFERVRTSWRMWSQATPEIPVSANGYKALHEHIFQDVYDWAGEYRTVNLAKDRSLFCLAPHIDDMMECQFNAIEAEGKLRQMAIDHFARRVAAHVAELNAIHPFREGNGRTLRLFIAELARQAGRQLRVSNIDSRLWMAGSIESFQHGRIDKLYRCIRQALKGRTRRT